MATQGAVQLQVVINGQSLTIDKSNAVSLSITRVIGDSADEFTLEAFDETAWKLETALIADKNGKATGKLAPISVMYSAADNLNKSILFTGTCLNYQTTFVGSATMLSITGVLAASTGIDDGWWFDSRAVQWVDTEPTERDGVWYVDGKSASEYESYKNNRDVCAILDFPKNSDGTVNSTNPTVYINPTRVFERIIHKYNGDKLGSTSGGTSTSTTISAGVSNNRSNTSDTVWNFFKGKGYTDAAVAGIMGNISQESGMSPTKLQNGKGPAAGLFQWENYSRKSDRWKQLDDYAKGKGTSWTDLITQLEYAWSEIKSYGMEPTLKSETNVEEATEYFEKVFERAGTPNMPRRIMFAQLWYTTYTSKSVRTVTTTTTAGEIEGWGTGGKGSFKIAESVESRWVAGLNCNQEKNQTAAQFITNVLCKNAVTNKHSDYKDETAGYRYWVDARGHHFAPIEYNNNGTKLKIAYGQKNSNVISFSMQEVGAMAMLGSETDSDGNNLTSNSSIDYLTGEAITVLGENIKDSGYTANSEETQKNTENINWWFANVQGIQISSSSTKTEISRTLASSWSKLEDLAISAELTMWGEYSEGHAPGDFLDIVITGPTGQRHYASGIYMILQITDSVSSDGYTQTMKLLKYHGGKTSATASGTYVDAGITTSTGETVTGDAGGKSTSSSTTSITQRNDTFSQNVPKPSVSNSNKTYNRNLPNSSSIYSNLDLKLKK